MSLVQDQLNHIDARLNRLLLARPVPSARSDQPETDADADDDTDDSNYNPFDPASLSPRARQLLTLIWSLPTSSSDSRPLRDSAGRPDPFTSTSTSAPGQQQPQLPPHHRPLSPARIQAILGSPALRFPCPICQTLDNASPDDAAPTLAGFGAAEQAEHTLEWVLLTKLTLALYATVLSRVMRSTADTDFHLEYYDSILATARVGGSAFSSLAAYFSPLAVFGLQMLPFHVAARCAASWNALHKNQPAPREHQPSKHDKPPRPTHVLAPTPPTVKGIFNALAHSLHRISLALSFAAARPLVSVRTEVVSRRDTIATLRDANAWGMGVLLGEGVGGSFCIRQDDGEGPAEESASAWQVNTLRSIAVMSSVMDRLTNHLPAPADSAGSNRAPALSALSTTSITPAALYRSLLHDDLLAPLATATGRPDQQRPLSPAAARARLEQLCTGAIPSYIAAQRSATAAFGRPPALARWWLPAVAALLLARPLARAVSENRQSVEAWAAQAARDGADLLLSLWTNWVLEPVRQVLATVRHDRSSQISVASGQSLAAETKILEQMVVDFVRDEAGAGGGADGGPLSDAAIAAIEARVRDGDVLPVLDAFRASIRHPLRSTLRGPLVRTLLIQLQKTKVDVALAMAGIDDLLKSQQLVFGLVALTPGLLATGAAGYWAAAAWRNRRGVRAWAGRGHLARELRQLDIMLAHASASPAPRPSASASPSPGPAAGSVAALLPPWRAPALPYASYGAIVCQVHRLRETAGRILPGPEAGQFAAITAELADVHAGPDRHRAVLERAWRGFGRWLQ